MNYVLRTTCAARGFRRPEGIFNCPHGLGQGGVDRPVDGHDAPEGRGRVALEGPHVGHHQIVGHGRPAGVGVLVRANCCWKSLPRGDSAGMNLQRPVVGETHLPPYASELYDGRTSLTIRLPLVTSFPRLLGARTKDPEMVDQRVQRLVHSRINQPAQTLPDGPG